MIQGAALVTGASDRLGRAMALRLAEMGFDLALHFGSNASGADETAQLVRGLGRKAETLQADFTDLDQVESLIDRAVSAVGQLSVLVNNASIFEYDNLTSATRESWARHINSNLQAPFILTQGFAAQALEATKDDRGEPLAQSCIINMVDQRVQKLTPEFMTYTLAKAGLWTLTQTSAQGLAPNIRVNAIGPGPVLRGARQSEDHFSKQRLATLLERGANPEDVVETLEYLVKSPSVTGQLICVDGGQHLGWKTLDIIGNRS